MNDLVELSNDSSVTSGNIQDLDHFEKFLKECWEPLKKRVNSYAEKKIEDR